MGRSVKRSLRWKASSPRTGSLLCTSDFELPARPATKTTEKIILAQSRQGAKKCNKTQTKHFTMKFMKGRCQCDTPDLCVGPPSCILRLPPRGVGQRRSLLIKQAWSQNPPWPWMTAWNRNRTDPFHLDVNRMEEAGSYWLPRLPQKPTGNRNGPAYKTSRHWRRHDAAIFHC